MAVQVGQVAIEIIYKTTPKVQVAQAAPEIVYTGTPSVQVAQVATEIVLKVEDKFWLAIMRLLDQ